MMSISECLLDCTSILLLGDKKRGFSLFNNPNIYKRIYRKNFNHAEFIGEKLCDMHDINCAHYFPVAMSNINGRMYVNYRDIKNTGCPVYLGSYDFRDEKSYEYFNVKVDDKDTKTDEALSKVLAMCPNEKNREELLNELMELFALDTYMGQVDRFSQNIIFMKNKKTNEIHLGPIFDFEFSLKNSYLDERCIYINALYRFKTIEDYKEFIKKYPKFKEILSRYLGIDLVSTIIKGYDSKEMKVPDDRIKFYRSFEEQQKDLIKRITN